MEGSVEVGSERGRWWVGVDYTEDVVSLGGEEMERKALVENPVTE